MDELSIIQKATIWALPVIFAITLHEVAHGWAALQCGDTTAKAQGRLTLNPLPHIDPIGTILLPLGLLLLSSPFLFGWAKPVPVNVRQLRNPRRDMALVAVAGPLANLLMALAWAFVFRLGVEFGEEWRFLAYAGIAGIMINSILMLLNLLPLLPLDGGRVLYSLLPPRLAEGFAKSEPYGFIILLVLLLTGTLGVLLGPPLNLVQQLVLTLAGLSS